MVGGAGSEGGVWVAGAMLGGGVMGGGGDVWRGLGAGSEGGAIGRCHRWHQVKLVKLVWNYPPGVLSWDLGLSISLAAVL